MKRIVFVFSCGLLAVALSGRAIPRQSNGASDIPADKKLVIALRALNTEQYNYLERNHRFADREQMLSYLREEEPGLLRKLPIDLEDQTSYQLAITTSADGQHYQITLQRTAPRTTRPQLAKTQPLAMITLSFTSGASSAATQRLSSNRNFTGCHR